MNNMKYIVSDSKTNNKSGIDDEINRNNNVQWYNSMDVYIIANAVAGKELMIRYNEKKELNRKDKMIQKAIISEVQ